MLKLETVGFGPGLVLLLSLLTFVTSFAALILQPDLSLLSNLWIATLILISLSLGLSVLHPIKSSKSRRSYRGSIILALDLIYCLTVAALVLSGWLNQDVIISPENLGASFGYRLILSSLVLLASILAAKDSINIIYNYSQNGQEALVFLAVRLSAVFALLLLGGILFLIVSKGIWAISWEFLTTPHRRLGTLGGISTCIEGSFWLVMGSMLVAAPLGIGAAIYLQEYSKNIRFKRIITIAVSCLNGVPSVVYGLFGLAFLVSTFGISLLAGSIVLGLMNLPTIILTSQEAIKSVPNSLREGSLALGATKWQTIQKVVIPPAMPGILTGLIIGVAKAAGETAPIMWTAVTFTATPVGKIFGVIPDGSQPVNNLCYHLLQLIQFLGAWDVESRAWGTALVLLILVLSINMMAIVVRNHYRKKIRW